MNRTYLNRLSYAERRKLGYSRLTQAERRKRRQDRIGGAIIGATILAAVGAFYGAVQIDAANGLTIGESLCTAGIGCTIEDSAALRAELRGDAPTESGFYTTRDFCDQRDCGAYLKARKLAMAEAMPARLIGRCGGRLYAGNSESSFPAGCDWIEPIKASD